MSHIIQTQFMRVYIITSLMGVKLYPTYFVNGKIKLVF